MVLPFLFALTMSTAEAKDQPQVAVVGLHDDALDDAEQRAAVRQLAAALEDGKRFRVLAPDDVARVISGREELILAEAYLSPGRRLLDDGRTLHDQAQPEEAIPVLEQAVESLNDAMSAADASRDLWEALLYLGACHEEIGRSDDAARSWSEAVALSPERQPDAARIPPNIVRSYLAARESAQKKTGGMTIKAPGQATISVNGRNLGPAPVKLESAPAGTIHIRARAPSGGTAYKKVQIVPGASGTVELQPGALRLPPPETCASPGSARRPICTRPSASRRRPTSSWSPAATTARSRSSSTPRRQTPSPTRSRSPTRVTPWTR